jgi:hypothetical protein
LIFSLGTWPPQIPTGFHRTPWYLGTNYRYFSFRVRAFHPLWKTIPDLSARKNTSNIACPATLTIADEFRLFRFRSPLLTESLMIYFPGATKMFQFTPYPAKRYIHSLRNIISCLADQQSWPGYPIRKPPDQRFMAPPRRVSPPYASFLGQSLQGIHYWHYK